MKSALRLSLLVLAISALTACSTSSGETWIGKNVGVTVDSSEEQPGGR